MELRQKANRKRQRPAEDDDDSYEGGHQGGREGGWLEECAREWPVTRIRQSGFCGECNIIKHLGVLVVVVAMGLVQTAVCGVCRKEEEQIAIFKKGPRGAPMMGRTALLVRLY